MGEHTAGQNMTKTDTLLKTFQDFENDHNTNTTQDVEHIKAVLGSLKDTQEPLLAHTLGQNLSTKSLFLWSKWKAHPHLRQMVKEGLLVWITDHAIPKNNHEGDVNNMAKAWNIAKMAGCTEKLYKTLCQDSWGEDNALMCGLPNTAYEELAIFIENLTKNKTSLEEKTEGFPSLMVFEHNNDVDPETFGRYVKAIIVNSKTHSKDAFVLEHEMVAWALCDGKANDALDHRSSLIETNLHSPVHIKSQHDIMLLKQASKTFSQCSEETQHMILWEILQKRKPFQMVFAASQKQT